METPEETKKCPYCAEDIKSGAIVCRFCGRELDPEAVRFVAQYVTRAEEPEIQSKKTAASTNQGSGSVFSGLFNTDLSRKPGPWWIAGQLFFITLMALLFTIVLTYSFEQDLGSVCFGSSLLLIGGIVMIAIRVSDLSASQKRLALVIVSAILILVMFVWLGVAMLDITNSTSLAPAP